MNWLIWKEYRLQRLLLIFGAVIAILPYGIPLIAYRLDEVVDGDDWLAAAIASASSAILTTVLIAGNSMACERADRSAEFQAYLPLPRYRILLGKLLIPSIVIPIVWTMNLPVLALASRSLRYQANPEELVGFFLCAVPIALCSVGVAWLVSSFQSSPTFAVGSGVLVPFVLTIGANLFVWIVDLEHSRAWAFGLLISLGLIGLACMAAGCWHYLKRVGP